MKEQMEALRQRFESELQAAQNSEAVEKLRVAYLGKKGSVTELLKGLKSVAGDQKKEMGQLINQLKRQVEEGIAQQVEKIRAAEEQAQIASAEQYDVTLPVDQSEGSYHPITLVQRQLEEIFSSMGFTIEDYKEIVTDYECFEAVNIPKHQRHYAQVRRPPAGGVPRPVLPQRGHRRLPREHLLPDGGPDD